MCETAELTPCSLTRNDLSVANTSYSCNLLFCVLELKQWMWRVRRQTHTRVWTGSTSVLVCFVEGLVWHVIVCIKLYMHFVLLEAPLKSSFPQSRPSQVQFVNLFVLMMHQNTRCVEEKCYTKLLDVHFFFCLAECRLKLNISLLHLWKIENIKKKYSKCVRPIIWKTYTDLFINKL